MKPNVAILSLGCPRNLVDSENILGRLDLKGFKIVEMQKADIALVNTCAFIDEAKQESVDAILDLVEMKKEGGLKKIIVYGCLAQRYKDALRKELPEVDAFIGRPSLNHTPKRAPLTPRHYVYLKICEGCLNNCSFCVIWRIKGKFSSLDQAAILKKVNAFSNDKVSEISIIGQDITGYGQDLYGKIKLTELLKKISKKAKRVGWIRLLYLYPSRISDELLALIRDTQKICKYIDIPIQHINERILRLMNRHTSKKEILGIIGKIRKSIPGVALRTSLITGFPSESDKEFKELLEFIQEVKFERLGAFIYSREEGTPAFNFAGQVPEKIKMQRFNEIMSVQQKISEEINKKLLGRTVEVLIDEQEAGGYLGRTQYDAPEVDGLVYVNSRKALRPGDFVKVKITDTLEYDLVGEA